VRTAFYKENSFLRRAKKGREGHGSHKKEHDREERIAKGLWTSLVLTILVILSDTRTTHIKQMDPQWNKDS
jgi:hypothetical protein